jgi:hypothetical protein
MTHPGRALCRAAFGTLTLTAVGVQLALHLRAGLPALNFFSYFTILSNTLAGIILWRAAWLGGTGRVAPVALEGLRFAGTLYMVVVGLVFIALLRGAELGILRPWINTTHHYIMPLVMLADWVLYPPGALPDRRTMGFALLFPLAYVGYSLIRGAATGWYPYPFFNPVTVGGYGTVAAFIVGMTVTIALAGLGIVWLARRHTGPRPERS